MKNNQTDFKDMRTLLRDAQKIAITMHLRPDGDCLGTAAALRLALLRMKKDVDVFVCGEVPSNLQYLEGVSEFYIVAEKNDKGFEFDTYDLLVIVDTADGHRLGSCQALIESSDKVIVFDHHLNPTIRCDLLVSNPTRASCGEMMFEYFVTHNVNITRPMAVALYTAISSDTGCFLFPNTTAYTHHAASELMNKGIDITHVNYSNFRVYDPKTLSGLMEVLKNIKFVADGQIAITYLSYKMVKKYKFDHDERHRFQRYAIDAQGVKVSIFLTEQERDSFNVSLRSHGDINVSKIANHFGGGGHKNAAGLTIKGRYKNIIKQIVEKVEEILAKQKPEKNQTIVVTTTTKV
ncbi:MAG: bifunctional oligoribonuclease/PAP phosphatase NrnA [Firmicutes bacterium]|nr:bifunctional oligoribonuclease/PAP phosphatase NrnA [Bacillota bacterium]